MCTMVKIKNKNNKMIAWRSWPSPPHLETSLTKASKKGPCGPRQAASAGGRTPDGASSAESAKALVDFFNGGGWRRKKEKQNHKCQRNFSGMKFLHHLESISAAAVGAGPPWCPRCRGTPPLPGRWRLAALLWTPGSLHRPGSSPSTLQTEEK